MIIWLSSLVVLLLVVLGMSLGVLAGRRGIEGTCGGLNRVPGLGDACGICPKRLQGRCPNRKAEDQAAA
jgi:hypothetical protein